MATVIGILCSISVFFTDSVELANPLEEQATPSNVIQLYNVHHYERIKDSSHHWEEEGPIAWLQSGYCLMGTDDRFEYIIGRLNPRTKMLQPLLAPREDFIGDRLGCVKVRIDGKIANVTKPMSRVDRIFHINWGKDYVVPVNVNGPHFG